MAHESAVNRGTKSLIVHLVRSADHDTQEKNLVGSLDQFAKTAGLCENSVNSI